MDKKTVDTLIALEDQQIRDLLKDLTKHDEIKKMVILYSSSVSELPPPTSVVMCTQIKEILSPFKAEYRHRGLELPELIKYRELLYDITTLWTEIFLDYGRYDKLAELSSYLSFVLTDVSEPARQFLLSVSKNIDRSLKAHLRSLEPSERRRVFLSLIHEAELLYFLERKEGLVPENYMTRNLDFDPEPDGPRYIQDLLDVYNTFFLGKDINCLSLEYYYPFMVHHKRLAISFGDKKDVKIIQKLYSDLLKYPEVNVTHDESRLAKSDFLDEIRDLFSSVYSNKHKGKAKK